MPTARPAGAELSSVHCKNDSAGQQACALAAGSLSGGEATYLQLGIGGIDESIPQNRVPVLNVGTTGETKKDKKKI